MENSKGHGKVMENDEMSWNLYYCTEQFCKSDMTSLIKQIINRNVILLTQFSQVYLLTNSGSGTVTTNSGMHS